MAAVALTVAYHVSFSLPNHRQRNTDTSTSLTSSSSPSSLTPSSFSSNSLLNIRYPYLSIISATERRNPHGCVVVACLPSSPSPSPQSRTTTSIQTTCIQQLYVSGLSFRTTEESLVNAFKIFGELVEVNLVMDRIANRPRGFAFLRYATEEESRKAIEGMHGKFLDGRVIFVEVAKPRWEVRQSNKQSPRQ